MKKKKTLWSDVSVLIVADLAITAFLRGTVQFIALLIAFGIWSAFAIRHHLIPYIREKKERNEAKRIKFNSVDPCHQQTIDILNAQGRRKAQFIVNAIMHYIHCPETPDIPQPTSDTTLIEGIVRRILQEQEVQNATTNTPNAPTRTIRKSENLDFKNTDEILGSEGMAAIAKTMASFRHT